jgi:phosphatidylethanolamine/phosphatidyl-N-methylethanolamine N-methyltransferase
MWVSDLGSFVRAWMADPLRVAAIVPSSRALAQMITAEITAASAPVIELGPGTGVFTRQLLARGIPEERLALVEYGSAFVQLLVYRFPAARVVWMDAAQLSTVCLFGGERAGAVVSGLPFLSMTPKQVLIILAEAFGYLRHDGAFYQFTYGLACPVPRVVLDRLGLESVRVGRALVNVPPAAVYRIRRRTRNRYRSLVPSHAPGRRPRSEVDA